MPIHPYRTHWLQSFLFVFICWKGQFYCLNRTKRQPVQIKSANDSDQSNHAIQPLLQLSAQEERVD